MVRETSSFFLELKEQLETIPDPRRKKGTRYPLIPLLLLLMLGFLRGGKDVKAILQTDAEDREMLDFLGLKRVPSPGVYTNLFQKLDLRAVNQALENVGFSLAPQGDDRERRRDVRPTGAWRKHLEKGGRWLFALKAHQQAQYAESTRLHGLRTAPDYEETSLVGGRIETRRLFLFPEMAGWFDWPHRSQGAAVEKHTVVKRTGRETREVFLALTSLPQDAPPVEILRVFRNHWSMENKVHHVLDVSMGEDACRVRAGCGAAIVGAMRRAALSLRQRIKGSRTIPETMRFLHSGGRILRWRMGNA